MVDLEQQQPRPAWYPRHLRQCALVIHVWESSSTDDKVERFGSEGQTARLPLSARALILNVRPTSWLPLERYFVGRIPTLVSMQPLLYGLPGREVYWYR